MLLPNIKPGRRIILLYREEMCLLSLSIYLTIFLLVTLRITETFPYTWPSVQVSKIKYKI
jgi:hypothetical protein